MHGFKVLGKKIYLSIIVSLFFLFNGNHTGCGNGTSCLTFKSPKALSYSYAFDAILKDLVRLIKKDGKFFFVWLHGMFEDNTCWEKVVPKITDSYPLRRVYHRIEPMFLESRVKKSTTALLAIEDQANIAVEEIKKGIIKGLKKLLGERYSNFNDEQKRAADALAIQYTPIALGGFSQGGLVAAMIGYNNTKKYGLNIQGIVCVQTPFNGVKAFEVGIKDTYEFVNKSISGLKQMGVQSPSKTAMNIFLTKILGIDFAGLLKKMGMETAISSMCPGSEAIEACCKFVRENIVSRDQNTGSSDKKPHNIPILLMAGCIDKLSPYVEYHSKNEGKLIKLWDALAKFIGGAPHDGTVSLAGQLCRSEKVPDNFSSINCLQHIAIDDWSYVMPNKSPNVEVYIAEKDVWHGKDKSKAILATFNKVKVGADSKEMFDYDQSKYRLAEWLSKRFNAWTEEA